MPEVSVIMGSASDSEVMANAIEILKEFHIDYEWKIVSAHRTPERLYEFAKNAEGRGVKVIIAGAGGAAHLPGMVAALTHLPVLGVPVPSKSLSGLDSLLSIVQMPGGVPVSTFAIGKAGAKNAALTAISILSLSNEILSNLLKNWRSEQSLAVREEAEHE